MVAQRRVLSPGHSAPRELQIKVVLAQDPSDRIESMLRNLLHPFFVDLVAVTHELRAAVPITLQAEPSGEARQLRLAGWQAGRQAGSAAGRLAAVGACGWRSLPVVLLLQLWQTLDLQERPPVVAQRPECRRGPRAHPARWCDHTSRGPGPSPIPGLLLRARIMHRKCDIVGRLHAPLRNRRGNVQILD
jgi:hypothetical protein